MVRLCQKNDDLKSLRDSALIQIACFGAFRRSELLAITHEHLSFEPRGLLIEIPRSKTDQTVEGKVKAIPYGKNNICPVTALKKWLEFNFYDEMTFDSNQPNHVSASRLLDYICTKGVEYAFHKLTGADLEVPLKLEITVDKHW